MKQTAVEFAVEKLEQFIPSGNQLVIRAIIEQAKEMEEKKLLEMLHKFGFDYTYNYKGEKTIYEWIPEWFKEYIELNNLKNIKL